MQRKTWLDSLKGIAILFVVIGHSGCPETLYNFIYSFHMPLFFVISGYLYRNEKWSGLGWRKFITGRARAYLVPYFVLCGVNYLLCLLEEVLRNGFTIGTVELMKKWLFGILYAYPDTDHMPDCTPLWFLVALFFANMIFYFIIKIKDKRKQITLILAFAAIDIVLAVACPIQLPWCFGAVLIGCCCMYFGTMIKKYQLTGCHNSLLAILFLLGAITSYINGKVGIGANNIGKNPLLFWVAALSLSFFFLTTMKKIGDGMKVLPWFGKNTILFMGFNYFFNTVTTTIWHYLPLTKKYDYNWAIKSMICVACISLLIFVWNKMKEKMPKLAELGF